MDAHHYLRAVYRLTDDPDERVGTGALADAVERSPAALHEEYETLRRFLDGVLHIDDPDEEAATLLDVVSADVLQRLDETVIPPPDDSPDRPHGQRD
ncbi:hypothetical protein GCM10009037_30070 [Halarchaeum grantii]|uniref:Uncharacterized protein n=1 Tax=Halarchaeum grantii TaxID=1193105 RepID=A0A830F6R0_9EURY|nr:hypothetical protein [Halarchaeum grantii]GGL44665.1 hypothetical protein GCM10009037_30070 [Halarchaeum grantii]